MPTLDRPRVETRTPEDLVDDVRSGRIRIPSFQRGFKWEAGDVVKLFDSIVRGYPIGNLLLWRRPAPRQSLRVGPVEVDADATDAALWVVDGQQRITSLVGALVAAESTPDTRFRVHLDLDKGTFHTAGPRQLQQRTWIPVSLLLDTRTLLGWMRENSEWLSEHQIALADQAAKAIQEYQIPTYVVRSTEEDTLVEIFARMNTQGKRLTKAEVFHALHSGMAGDEPTDLHSIGQVTAHLDFGALDDRLVLRGILAFRGGDIFREEFREEFASDADRADTFREVAAVLREVVAFLRDDAAIPHVRLLPYSHVVPILVRFVHLHGVPAGRAATLLRRWVWRSAVAGTRARGISVASLRGQVNALDGGDQVGASQKLLSHVPTAPGFAVELDKVYFKHAMAKINVLGMLACEPRELATGTPLYITRLLESGSPLVPIFPDGVVPENLTLAGRFLTSAKAGRELRLSLAVASPDIAASHLVDPEAQQMLRDDDVDGFLVRRARTVATAIASHVDQMAEWGARDGRAVSDMIRPAV